MHYSPIFDIITLVIKMQRFDTVLFDLDGTLIDSNELIIKSFYETMVKYMPQKDFTREELIEMIGPPLSESFKIATDSFIIIEEMIDYYREVYTKLEFEYIKIYPNVINTLKVLSENNINLGIVTTKFKKSAMPSILHYGIDKYITSYCFLDDTTKHKPDPAPIFYALNQFESYQNVLMVGDSGSDILAGINASCKTCAVDWTIKRHDVEPLNPDYWLNNYSELLNWVLEKEK